MKGREGTSWADQWARIQRWRERVRQSRDDGRTDFFGTEGYRDKVFALFQAIWHLKDWIRNDSDLNIDRETIESWLRGDSAHLLKIASDVANGSKHLRLTNQRADGSRQTRNDVAVLVGVSVKHTFYVTDARDDADWEVLTLADACLEEWKKFLKEHRLTIPTE